MIQIPTVAAIKLTPVVARPAMIIGFERGGCGSSAQASFPIKSAVASAPAIAAVRIEDRG